MEEIVKKINEQFAAFAADAEKAANGNKAAGTRARVASLEIEKALKEFRKISLSK